MSQDQIAALIDSLQPGDTLTFAAGTYQGREIDLHHKDGSPIVGTSGAPITIQGVKAADGTLPHLIADTGQYQEAVAFESGDAFIVLEDLALSSVGSTTQAGVRIDDGTNNLTIQGCQIFDTTGIGIQAETHSNIHDVTIVDNQIYDTGTNGTDGGNGGQAFTAGGFTPDKATTGVYRILIRHNLIHDNMGQEGDCMKFMYGVYASVMEDNVAYNCPRGSAQAENYGLTSYGSGVGHADNAADNNILRRNFLANTRGLSASEDNVAIYAGPGTTVENNLIVVANIGIAARLESEVPNMRNLRVVHNTVYDVTDHAFSIRGSQNADASVVVANNALIAVQASAFGYRAPDPLGGTVFVANYFTGQDYAEASAPAVIAITQPIAEVFTAPSSTIDKADFMPLMASVLVDHADPPTSSTEDFDLAPRPFGPAADVGCYEFRSDLSNHWQIGAGFKGSQGAGPIPPSSSSSTGSGTSTGGGTSTSKSGCGCTVVGDPNRASWLVAVLALGAAMGGRRCRRGRRCDPLPSAGRRGRRPSFRPFL
jgi:hypothetical protein